MKQTICVSVKAWVRDADISISIILALRERKELINFEPMLNRDDILKTLREQMAFLQSQYHVKQIGLFGSVARGENTEQSDIDFLVVIDTDAAHYRQTKLALKNYLSHLFGKAVDVANPQSLKPHFKDRILASAVYA